MITSRVAGVEAAPQDGVAPPNSGAGGVFLLPAEVPEMPVADQFPPIFIPQSKVYRFQAGKESDRFHLVKHRIRAMAAFEVVVGNPGAEMVDVVEPNIAGKPLQDLRQFVEGAALQGGGGVIPVGAAFPINVLELVLDVEHPDTRATRHGHGNQLDDEISFEAKSATQGGGHGDEGKIHPVDGGALA